MTGEGTVGALLAKGKTNSKSIVPEIFGKGTGSFLLDGGLGGQSSYTSPANYTATTGRVIRSGKGLEKLSSKLGQLNIKPKKQNIKFDL
jgi:hypothetical protein